MHDLAPMSGMLLVLCCSSSLAVVVVVSGSNALAVLQYQAEADAEVASDGAAGGKRRVKDFEVAPLSILASETASAHASAVRRLQHDHNARRTLSSPCCLQTACPWPRPCS